jgi:hypothetical protein
VRLSIFVCVQEQRGEAVVFRRNAQHIDELLTIFCRNKLELIIEFPSSLLVKANGFHKMHPDESFCERLFSASVNGGSLTRKGREKKEEEKEKERKKENEKKREKISPLLFLLLLVLELVVVGS